MADWSFEGPMSPTEASQQASNNPDEGSSVKESKGLRTPIRGNLRKFHTTAEDHERGKRRWGLPHPHRFRKIKPRKSAADPEWLREWIDKNGPYLVHKTKPEVLGKIFEEGLIPHDQGPGTIYDQELVPRANHSYLRVPTRINPRSMADVFVDLRKLDPERINGDEDNFTSSPEFPRVQSSHHKKGNEDYWVYEPRTGRRFRHFGEWADYHRPDRFHHVAHSLSYGTVAIYGGVSPEALATTAQALPELRDGDYGFAPDPFDSDIWRRYHPVKIPYKYIQDPTGQMGLNLAA